MPHQAGRSVASRGAADPGLGHGSSQGGGPRIPSPAACPTPPKPPRLTLLEALTDSSRSKTVSGASLPPTTTTLGLTPQGLRPLSLGALREGLRLGPCLLAHLPHPAACLRTGTQLQPSVARTVLLVAASLVNGICQRGLICCSFPR